MSTTEPGDRGVIRLHIGGDHPERDIALTPLFDTPRRHHPRRIGIHQQRHHHLRMMSRPTPAVIAIRRIKLRQIQLLDRVDHEPRQMILRQPIRQRRRQQHHLITIKPNKVER
jgi:hypothetical protein